MKTFFRRNKDEQYLEIREKLKRLPRINASENFMNSLQQKINLLEAEKENKQIPVSYIHDKKKNSLLNLLGFKNISWFVPATSFSIILLALITVFIINNIENDKSEQNLGSNQNTLMDSSNLSIISPQGNDVAIDNSQKTNQFSDREIAGNFSKDNEKLDSDDKTSTTGRLYESAPTVSPSTSMPESSPLLDGTVKDKTENKDRSGNFDYLKTESDSKIMIDEKEEIIHPNIGREVINKKDSAKGKTIDTLKIVKDSSKASKKLDK